MNILDLSKEQLQHLVSSSMAIDLPSPELGLLRDELLEFLLRLHEIKLVAIEAIERGSNIPPHRIIELLDGEEMKADVIKEIVHPQFINPGDHVFWEGALRQVTDRYGKPPSSAPLSDPSDGNWTWIVTFAGTAEHAEIYDSDENPTMTRLAAVIRL